MNGSTQTDSQPWQQLIDKIVGDKQKVLHPNIFYGLIHHNKDCRNGKELILSTDINKKTQYLMNLLNTSYITMTDAYFEECDIVGDIDSPDGFRTFMESEVYGEASVFNYYAGDDLGIRYSDIIGSFDKRALLAYAREHGFDMNHTYLVIYSWDEMIESEYTTSIDHLMGTMMRALNS